jgi:hypothetical protein
MERSIQGLVNAATADLGHGLMPYGTFYQNVHSISIIYFEVSLIWIEEKEEALISRVNIEGYELISPLGLFAVSLYRFRYLFHSILFPAPAFHSHKLALL